MIERFRSRQGDNYSYLIYSRKAAETVLVDPVAVPQIKRFVEARSLSPRGLINTHGHSDHTAGNREFVGQRGLQVLAHPGDHRPADQVDRELRDGESLELGGVVIQVIHTPGHTPGSICLRLENHLIAGDTLFLAGCGNTRFGGDIRQLFGSISRKLLNLPEHLMLLPGHDYARRNLEFAHAVEPKNRVVDEKLQTVRKQLRNGEEPVSTLGEEKRYNPFFRFDRPGVRENLSGLSTDASARECFFHLRKLRDEW